jgi:hypothetical protein
MFSDLGIVSGLWERDQTTYRARFRREDGSSGSPLSLDGRQVELPGPDGGQLEVALQLRRKSDTRWSREIHVYLGPDDSDGYKLLGLIRDD